MGLAAALRPVVSSLTSTFGRTAYIVHRSAGTFDTETGRRARSATREKVSVVIADGASSEQTVAGPRSGTPIAGLSRSCIATVAAVDMTSVPTTEAVLELPVQGKVPEVWQIVRVSSIEEGGVPISYDLDIRR
jgi:hypothetical protein